jgi:pyruvate/2-oxoglutarate/acetoin dehydrogenase E1 component/TPP-dependent pyruvate/acetoin dehydrogenase alpha subunit
MLSIDEFFAQLYAHADVEADPSSAGRSMTAHFATRNLHPDGTWKKLTTAYNSSADVSPTASQMPRLVGLGYASKLYRQVEELKPFTDFSVNGDEIAFGTIGNASCAEGMFWEAVNACGVLGAAVLISIWDDEYGISVHNEHQITKGDLSAVLQGFQRQDGSTRGFDIHRVCGWDYPALCETYRNAAEVVRGDHVPAIIHVVEVTQPQGHSTSGSHERYKDADRLKWEEEHDCIRKMREWMIDQRIVDSALLGEMEAEDKQLVGELKDRAWKAFSDPIRKERDTLAAILGDLGGVSSAAAELTKICDDIQKMASPIRRDLARVAADALVATCGENSAQRSALIAWQSEQQTLGEDRYSSHLHSASPRAAIEVQGIAPTFDESAKPVRGFEVLNACFDSALSRCPEVVAFGQDLGKLGDVNQGFAGLQAKYGELRVSDVGIRECTIIGQAIGLAMRGLRPIVEIQYLDYLLYALQILSDDLATLRYRTKGGQMAPVIIRTRGHRLEGIWHSGSPMAGVINLIRGIYVCVPRDMTRAAGFYNTLLQSDDCGLIIEVLNGYRLREALPTNVGSFTVPLGVPEVIREGRDLTLVTYGACCRIALDAAHQLAGVGIDLEVIDVQTLLPFDTPGRIVQSIEKTGRVVFLDEDVPGGATAYMMQQVLDVHDGYRWLDSRPRTVSAQPHRPAYGSDGDYWSKPNREQVFRVVYEMMREAAPATYPPLD